jgi:hypothetical protein
MDRHCLHGHRNEPSLIFGRISEYTGKTSLFLAGFTIFTASSLACGLSVNLLEIKGCFQIKGTVKPVTSGEHNEKMKTMVNEKKQGQGFPHTRSSSGRFTGVFEYMPGPDAG